MNEQEVFKTHDEIMALEKQGVIGKSLREPLKPKLQSKPITPQTDLARTCYKLWRQFDLEGKPDNFNFTPHITAINEKYNALYQEQPKEQPLEVCPMFEMPMLCNDCFPKIVCLCGSTRFSEAFQKAQFDEIMAGNIVLTIGCNMKSDTELFKNYSEQELTEIKTKLDELHKRKIDLANEVLILNVGGYIGESTKGELEYARQHRKTIRFLEPAS
jgi:hypothetical protein